MVQKESEPDANNVVGMDDDIAKKMIEDQKAQASKEIELFKDNIKRTKEAKERMWEQWLVDQELWQIQLDGDNHERVEPVYKFERSPRYNELRKKKIQWQFEQDKFQAESRNKGYDKTLADLEFQLKSAEDLVKELEAEQNE